MIVTYHSPFGEAIIGKKINETFTHVLTTLPYIAQGEWQEAMLILHSKEKK